MAGRLASAAMASVITEAPVRVELDGPVTTVVLDRPTPATRWTARPRRPWLRRSARSTPTTAQQVAVLYGDGGTFCAGADLKAIGTERGNQVTEDGDGPMGPTRLRLASR